ncbi:hypothetical protein BSZ39_00970 [Bowdeniella nasicola]|uniref:Uncharacterized protein n=1 Tax=Bowdeniella nasicola TaxID=208480 RepID=A0A1Q5Q5B9_9ACTO|nr:hypothetical protein [Bowdeniella nasicola]OKL54983.1 hypothetical protein BSZ39_00970 [Bowdeniella nasicola]
MTYCDTPEKILQDKSVGEPYHALAAAIRERDAARARDIMIDILHHFGFEACAGFVPNGATNEADA